MSDEAKRLLSRRAALSRLGALAAGVYCAPSLTTLSTAEAKGSNSGSGSGSSGSGSDNSGSGSGNSGSGSSSSASGSSGSGSSGSGTGKGGTGSSGGKSRVFGGDGIHVQFADGHIERIRDGSFERLNKGGKTVERRAARQSDVNRLRRLNASAKGQRLPRNVHAVIEIDEVKGHIEITDYRGWTETVSGSTYELKDPNGRTVTRRALTTKDIFRIRDVLQLE